MRNWKDDGKDKRVRMMFLFRIVTDLPTIETDELIKIITSWIETEKADEVRAIADKIVSDARELVGADTIDFENFVKLCDKMDIDRKLTTYMGHV